MSQEQAQAEIKAEVQADAIKKNGFFAYSDLVEAIKNGGRDLPLKPYEPESFWESIGERYYNMFDRREKFYVNVPWIADRLRLFKGQIRSILDVGCGFGRVLPFLFDAKLAEEFVGVDISKSVLACSEKYLEPLKREEVENAKILEMMDDPNVHASVKQAIAPQAEIVRKALAAVKKEPIPDYRKLIRLEAGDARRLTYKDSSFDCVLGSEILQHLCPDEAFQACREMLRVSANIVILVERWQFPGEHSEPHIWSHGIHEMFFALAQNGYFNDVLQVTTVGPGLQGAVIKKK